MILCTITNSVFAQTQEEKNKIIDSYNLNAIEQLQAEISEQTNKNKLDVDNFLKQSNLPRVIESYNSSNKKELYRIIDGIPIYRTTFNINSAKATRTNFLHNGGGLGLDLEGQNMNIGIWDGGSVLSTHQEFAQNSRVTVGDNSASNSHGTHVGGTLVAQGVQANAKGMAPQAALTSFDWNNDLNEVTVQAATNALLLSNHSYGVGSFDLSGNLLVPATFLGLYESEARSIDQISYNSPYYLMVVAAGNDGTYSYTGALAPGYDKLSSNTTAKNNLVVANANNPIINGATGDLIVMSINASSSQGPTDDGRIKPDIAGDGTSVYSSTDLNTISYDTTSGTSMASPNVAGSLLLLQQYYNELNSNFLKASTLKGLVCHTADDDGSKVGPDPIFGWGLLNAKAAAETILDDSNGSALILESNLANSNTYTFTFSASGTAPLSATICWTDPAGTAQNGPLNNPIPALVNDLDLRLTAPDGTTVFMPWKLQLSDVSLAAITGDNNVDTVENIDIANPVAGSYTLTVTHKGALTNSSQDFSLILTGSDLTLSTDENTLADFAIWPNPADNVLNYQLNSANSNKTFITLVDVHGRSVYNNSFSANNQLISGSINTEALSQGIYFLRINQGNTSTTKKVIIK